MGHFSEMEWNSKWDWENLVMCDSKSTECPKKLQLAANCITADNRETDAGSFNLSAGCGNSSASGSESGHVYSAKSSISASTESSTKDGMQTPIVKLMSFDGFSGNCGEKMELKGAKLLGTSLYLDSAIGSGEQLIGLKLGKRTYFENSGGGGSAKSASIPVVPTPSIITMKKTKSSGQILPAPRCIVEGCNLDLSTAKEYHRKHRVCENHAKYPKVIVGGLERRFCQQCSRFHSLVEFDEKKRSCRKRLSDHNARRRKPKQETIQFNSSRLSSPFYEERQQPVSFVFDNASSLINFSSPGNTAWTSTGNTKFTMTKGYSVKEVSEGRMKLPPVPNLPSRNSTLNPGSEGSMMSSHIVDTAPQYSRALSLLSTNSWHPTPETGGTYAQSVPPMMMTTATTMVNIIPEDVVMGSSEVWSSSSSSGNGNALHASYEAADMFSNILN